MQAANQVYNPYIHSYFSDAPGDPESLRIKSITHVSHGELRCAKSGPPNQPESRGSANLNRPSGTNPEGLTFQINTTMAKTGGLFEVCLRSVAILFIWVFDMNLFCIVKPHITQIVTDLKQTFKQTPFLDNCCAICGIRVGGVE